jgi:ribosomal protein L25 (general stress protein Ctc)
LFDVNPAISNDDMSSIFRPVVAQDQQAVITRDISSSSAGNATTRLDFYS